jgi:hypothetical protein
VIKVDLSKSVDFLLENAGDVIKYRLRKEILHDLSEADEAYYLEKIMRLHYYQLLEKYQKPNGFIGVGLHSYDKFQETPLMDAENAARLISYYAIPKTVPLVRRFAEALQDELILEEEFSFLSSVLKLFRNRHIGTESGSSLQLLIDACLALMGFGDDSGIERTKKISFDAIESVLSLKSFLDITQYNPNVHRKYNYPYILPDTLYPCVYHLQVLSHTYSWRNTETLKTLADVLNRINAITPEPVHIHVRAGNTYHTPLWELSRPLKPYETNCTDSVCYRRSLTDIVMLGIGKQVEVTKISAERLLDDLKADGILRLAFKSAAEKRKFKACLEYPGPYNDVRLEPDYKTDLSIWCDLTFWAVQFLSLYDANQTQSSSIIFE